VLSFVTGYNRNLKVPIKMERSRIAQILTHYGNNKQFVCKTYSVSSKNFEFSQDLFCNNEIQRGNNEI
jgi:hypothetical protein